MDCKVWLRKLLSDGDTHSVEEIRKLRKEYGFTKAELKFAKKELGVIVTNDSYIQGKPHLTQDRRRFFPES